MLSASELLHTALLERYLGDSEAGATFGPSETLRCYVEHDRRLLDQTYGSEVGVEGVLYANDLDVPAGSRMRIGNRTTYVLSVRALDDGAGSAHAEIALSARPPAAALRTAVIELARPGAGTPIFDDDSQTSTAAPNSYAQGVAASIAPDTAAQEQLTGEDLVSTAPYLVTTAASVSPREGDLVRITSCPADLSLEGRTFRITSVLRGTQRYERELRCELVSNL